MASYSTGASWGFPEDLPGGWEKPEREDIKNQEDEKASSDAEFTPPGPTPPPNPPPRHKPRTHYPPRQCRICLEVVLPTFHSDEGSALPAAFQRGPRVTYESPDGGRLLRPCKCKGSQKYVHEACLSAWRMQDPLQKRNYFQCPTCRYRYRLQRLRWSRWIGSTVSQVGLTVLILLLAMFVLGFVADPIINLYLDPVETIATGGGPSGSLYYEDEPVTWTEHFAKGLASLGLLGFVKYLIGLGPWHWFNMRGIYIGGGGRAGGGTGRDRFTTYTWIAIVVGIATFLFAVWKGVRAFCRRILEQAGERVMDVPGGAVDDDDDD